MDKVPRKEHQPIRVWCLPEEKAQIEANARDAGLSVSRYLRSVGMGYKIKGVIDAQLVLQLAKINGDQGRLQEREDRIMDELWPYLAKIEALEKQVRKLDRKIRKKQSY
jgi:hypothetical protein